MVAQAVAAIEGIDPDGLVFVAFKEGKAKYAIYGTATDPYQTTGTLLTITREVLKKFKGQE